MSEETKEVKKDIVVKKESMVDKITKRVSELTDEGRLNLPENYSAGNALYSAWLKLSETKNRQDVPVLNACTPSSIQTALFEMVVQGLNPAKDQCYFIAYGKELQMMPSYFGKLMSLKRVKSVNAVVANVVYEKDIFEVGYDSKGIKVIKKHETAFGNEDGIIVGAYCRLIFDNGEETLEVMTRKQIDASWAMGKAKSSPARDKFPDQMSKRTVINRAVKLHLKTSSDQDLLVESILRTTAAENSPELKIEQHIDIEDITDEEITVISKDAEEID